MNKIGFSYIYFEVCNDDKLKIIVTGLEEFINDDVG